MKKLPVVSVDESEIKRTKISSGTAPVITLPTSQMRREGRPAVVITGKSWGDFM